MTSKQAKLYPHMVLMIDVLCACIETRVYPVHGSPCHRMARRLVADSGMAPKRMRRRLPARKGAAAAMPWEGGRCYAAYYWTGFVDDKHILLDTCASREIAEAVIEKHTRQRDKSIEYRGRAKWWWVEIAVKTEGPK